MYKLHFETNQDGSLLMGGYINYPWLPQSIYSTYVDTILTLCYSKHCGVLLSSCP